jgi:RNA polymerase sigma factor (sigma-70 family)
MNTTFEQLKKHKSEGNRADFNRILDTLLPKLERYIRHRIKIFELKGLLPKNYYSAADIVADVYLKIYDNFGEIKDEKQLKIEIFRMADEILQSYVSRHTGDMRKIPVSELLREELKMLNEDFTVDADGDLVLVEELDDIEYRQDDFKRKIYLFDKSAEEYFARALGLSPEDFNDEKFRALFGNLYASLPETSRRILDLVAQAGLTPDETAMVTGIDRNDVTEVLMKLKTLLRK